MRTARQARIGDTIFAPSEWLHNISRTTGKAFAPLPGYADAKPMLFASVYPVDSDQLESMMEAVERLLLNDSSISVARDKSTSLGSGLRCGFLGFLHMEVGTDRIC
jgi:translation elongation factor EF-4